MYCCFAISIFLKHRYERKRTELTFLESGTWKDVQWPDGWTAVTADGKLSAQFEETLVVTETGVEVLTKRRTRNGQPYFMDT